MCLNFDCERTDDKVQTRSDNSKISLIISLRNPFSVVKTTKTPRLCRDRGVYLLRHVPETKHPGECQGVSSQVGKRPQTSSPTPGNRGSCDSTYNRFGSARTSFENNLIGRFAKQPNLVSFLCQVLRQAKYRKPAPCLSAVGNWCVGYVSRCEMCYAGSQELNLGM